MTGEEAREELREVAEGRQGRQKSEVKGQECRELCHGNGHRLLEAREGTLICYTVP